MSITPAPPPPASLQPTSKADQPSSSTSSTTTAANAPSEDQEDTPTRPPSTKASNPPSAPPPPPTAPVSKENTKSSLPPPTGAHGPTSHVSHSGTNGPINGMATKEHEQAREQAKSEVPVKLVLAVAPAHPVIPVSAKAQAPFKAPGPSPSRLPPSHNGAASGQQFRENGHQGGGDVFGSYPVRDSNGRGDRQQKPVAGGQGQMNQSGNGDGRGGRAGEENHSGNAPAYHSSNHPKKQYAYQTPPTSQTEGGVIKSPIGGVNRLLIRRAPSNSNGFLGDRGPPPAPPAFSTRPQQPQAPVRPPQQVQQRQQPQAQYHMQHQLYQPPQQHHAPTMLGHERMRSSTYVNEIDKEEVDELMDDHNDHTHDEEQEMEMEDRYDDDELYGDAAPAQEDEVEVEVEVEEEQPHEEVQAQEQEQMEEDRSEVASFDPLAPIEIFDIPKELANSWDEIEQGMIPCMHDFAYQTFKVTFDAIITIQTIYLRSNFKKHDSLSDGVKKIEGEEEKQKYYRKTVEDFSAQMARVQEVLQGFGTSMAASFKDEQGMSAPMKQENKTQVFERAPSLQVEAIKTHHRKQTIRAQEQTLQRHAQQGLVQRGPPQARAPAPAQGQGQNRAQKARNDAHPYAHANGLRGQRRTTGGGGVRY